MPKKKDYEALLPQVALGESIPQRIYQTYKSREALAPEFVDNIAHIQQINPGWEHQLYVDADIEEFIKREYNQQIWGYYQRISPRYGAARADFFRYLLLYKCGGLYLDIKSSITRPLSTVLGQEDKYLLYHWDNEKGHKYEGFGYFADLPQERFPYGEYSQWMLCSVAGHPILRAMILAVLEHIDSYNPFTDGVGLRGVLRTTGPILYSLVIEQIKPKLLPELYRQIRCAEELGFRYSVLDEGGAFAHRRKVNSYNAELSAVCLNGSEKYTHYLHFFFYLRWASEVALDKCRAQWGRLFPKK